MKHWNESFEEVKYPKNLSGIYEEFTVSQKVENGKVVKTGSFEKVSQSDRIRKYKVGDFSLENILAVGATDLLKPVQLSQSTGIEVGESLDKSFLDLQDAIFNDEVLNNNVNNIEE